MHNPTDSASKAQTFAIFCALKVDVRECNLTREQASSLLEKANGGQREAAIAEAVALGAVVKGSPRAALGIDAKARAKTQAPSYAAIWKEAKAAGVAAGNAAQCVPMHVVQRANVMDDASPIVHRYEPVMDGVCGFASVVIRPATSGFAKWLKTKGYASPHYYGGYSIFIGEHNQSLTRKEAHASAMAEVFGRYGYNAHCDSRID